MKEGVVLLRGKSLPQEGLKIIACAAMLIDHIGAVLVPLPALRIVGRLAFPIYCFLLAEGMAHTRGVKKYALRLALSALLAEVPYDLMRCGEISWMYQNVMVTLLLGCLMVIWMEKMPGNPLVPVLACAMAAQLLRADYGAMGIAMIALFVLTRAREDRVILQVLGLGILCWMNGGTGWRFWGIHIPIQAFGVAAMVPICLYSGGKMTDSRFLQWGFYLFYPVHMAVMWLVRNL